MSHHSMHDEVVYIVDDDIEVRNSMKGLFESVGLTAQTFDSSSELLGGLQPNGVGCLILDVRLPGLSGLDLQSELRRNNINIPIIFMTGYGDISMTVKAMRGGAVEFFEKPVREQDLLDAVYRALEKERSRRHENAHLVDLHKLYATLSVREQQVMWHVCMGRQNKQTAAEIGISEITVKLHRQKIMSKLGLKTVPDLVRVAGALGISTEIRPAAADTGRPK